MVSRPPGHYKSKSSGLAQKHGWEMEGISISSREPTYNSTFEDIEIKKRLVQIRTGRENILPPRNGFKYVGFKSNERMKVRHAVARSELPSIVAYQAAQLSSQLSPLVINRSNFASPPTTNRRNQNRNGRSGTGYYLKPITQRDVPQNKTSESRNNSASYRDDNSRTENAEGSSMYELAMSRINYWPLDNILEESPIGGGLKPIHVILERDHFEESTTRRGPGCESNQATRRDVEINAKNITEKLKKQSELKRDAQRMPYSGKDSPVKADIPSEYFNANRTAVSNSNRDNSKLEGLGIHPHINTLLGFNNALESSRRRANGQFDPFVPKEEVHRQHKESFMKLIYKGMGNNVPRVKHEKFFVQMCEEKRLAFKKKMEGLKALKQD